MLFVFRKWRKDGSVQSSKLKGAGKSLLNNFKMSIPILAGVLLLVGLVNTAIPKDFFSRIFTGKLFLDPFIGALVGGVAAGNPLTSYIIGGEFLEKGISLVSVLAFIVSWVTVGVVQLPAESLMLGRRFALLRNGVSFLMAVLVAILAAFTLEIVW